CSLGSDVDGQPYQRTSVAAFLPPAAILDIVADRAGATGPGLVVFCGTIVSLTGQLRFGERWSCRLADPALGRELTVDYRVVDLMAQIREPYRVPVTGGGG
ncbi:MAG TPA: DUF2848 family protein, partial [Natronosporangium sp.]